MNRFAHCKKVWATPKLCIYIYYMLKKEKEVDTQTNIELLKKLFLPLKCFKYTGKKKMMWLIKSIAVGTKLIFKGSSDWRLQRDSNVHEWKLLCACAERPTTWGVPETSLILVWTCAEQSNQTNLVRHVPNNKGKHIEQTICLIICPAYGLGGQTTMI